MENPRDPHRFWPRRRTLLVILPLAFCYWLHQYALRSWFWSDDFAWLGLHTQIFDRATFVRAMFEPLAQGTIRPWSERGFFLLFFRLFGFDALPYHGLVFATQCANILLLFWIVRKIGGSWSASCLAPALWIASSAMVTPMSWASDYNQILCSFFLLTAFALYLAGHYWWQFAVFVLGFGALEINIVYPAVLLAWLLLNKKSWRPAAPLFAVSALYYLIHRHYAVPARTGPYVLHFDASILKTLFSYWKQAFVPAVWYVLPHHPLWLAGLAVVSLSLAVLLTAIRIGRNALLFLAWFFITLAPILPLRDHTQDYYLAIPSLGLATLLALVVDIPFRFRPLLAVPALVYLWFQVPTTRMSSRWNFERSREVRNLVLGVVRARELHPGKTILLAHVSPQLYAFSIAHSPFHAAEIDNVYLSPETDFSTYPDLVPPTNNRLPAGPALYGLSGDQIVVYQPGPERIRNITASYRQWAQKNLVISTPSRLDVGIPLMTYLLGSTWYPLEGNYRWMPDVASIRIAGPKTPNQQLAITGYCPKELTLPGPVSLDISIDGRFVAGLKFSKPETPFERIVNLPAYLVGKDDMEVRFQVNRTFPGPVNGRPQSLAFGIFEIQ